MHLALLPSGMLMRVFCRIVRVLRSVVNRTWEYCTNRRYIATQTIRHCPSRFGTLTGQHFAKESFGSGPTSATLHQDIEHVTVLVHRAPKVILLATPVAGASMSQPAPASPRRRQTVHRLLRPHGADYRSRYGRGARRPRLCRRARCLASSTVSSSTWRGATRVCYATACPRPGRLPGLTD